MPEINKLFRMVKNHQASDLYLQVGSPPQMKLRGVDRKVDMRPLTQVDMERLLLPILYADQRESLNRGEEIVFIYAYEEGDGYSLRASNDGGEFKLSAHRLAAG